MKLNLLPTTVNRGKVVRSAIVLSVLLAGAGIGMAAMMMTTSRKALADAKANVESLRPQAKSVVDRARVAETVIKEAAIYNLNLGLAESMLKHNEVYPALYDEVRKYIPSWFRINSLNATPGGADSCTVTMTGVLQSYQQYNDIMFALLRIPGARTVSRSGYSLQDKYLPGVTETDPNPKIVERGQPRVADDPVDRLDQLIAAARVPEEVSGGFGNPAGGQRTAMPTFKNVTVAVVLAGAQRNLLAPDARGTLGQAAGLVGAAGGGGGQGGARGGQRGQ